MIRNHSFFHIRQHGIFLLRTGDDRLKGNHQVLLIHSLPAVAHGPQGGFVHQVRQIRAHGAGGSLGNLMQVHILRQPDPLGMDLQRVQTALKIRAVHNDPAVKPAGPQKRLVQNLRPVGGSQAYHALG